jgi:hypothetical protein
MRNRLPLIVAAFSVAVATGCTTATAGTPLRSSTTSKAPSSDAPPNSSDDLPSDGAPKVENPLDISHFEQSPCDVLTTGQSQELNIPATGEQQSDALGESCTWRNSETRGMVTIKIFSGVNRGLSSIYQEAEAKDFQHFEPINSIDGYPAVAYNVDSPEPTADCSVAIGVTDQLAFDMTVALSNANINKKNPCELAATVAAMALKTMREAS